MTKNNKRPVYIVGMPVEGKDDAITIIEIKQTAFAAEQVCAKNIGSIVKKGFVTVD